MGIIGDRTSAADYDDDMRRAKDAGIDAFALNIGTDSNVDQQLGYAYQSAANNGMKVFISFDFNWFKPGNDAATVGRMIAQYGSQPGQLIVDNRIFASTFAGDGLDVNAVKSAAGSDVFFVPNFHPEQSSAGSVDGAFNWMVGVVNPVRKIDQLIEPCRDGLAMDTTRHPRLVSQSVLPMETTST
jgi:hypothetical protein